MSTLGKQLRVADKICNVRDVAHRPPSRWSLDRRREYVEWASRVVDGCRGVNDTLDQLFDESAAEARSTLAGEDS